MKLLDRFMGLALGTVSADAIAAPYENRKSEFICAELERRGGLVAHRYIEPWLQSRGKPDVIKEPRTPTDDGNLFVEGLWSIVQRPEFDPSHMFNGFNRFIIKRKSRLTEKAYGVGETLKAALSFRNYQLSCEAFSRGEIQMVESNGGLMRCGWVPLRYHRRTPLLVKYARWQSCITHMHPLSQAACIAYSVLVSQVLDGLPVPVAWEATKEVLRKPVYAKIPGLETILSVKTERPTDAEIWPNTGAAVLSFRVALWASLTATDFRDGITKCTVVGGDTDTYAAIAGGILGARFGVQGIPEDWLNGLQGRQVVERLVRKVYKITHPLS